GEEGDGVGEEEARGGAAGEAHPVDQGVPPVRAPVRARPGRLHRSLRVESESSAKRIERIQKRTITFGSAHPESSKWWWRGDMRKTRRPVSLKEVTWMMTERTSRTKRPPTRTRRISCLARTATAPMAPPKESDPTSPMKTSAG